MAAKRSKKSVVEDTPTAFKCPYTGKEIQITSSVVRTGKMWFAVAPDWTSRPFASQEELAEFLAGATKKP